MHSSLFLYAAAQHSTLVSVPYQLGTPAILWVLGSKQHVTRTLLPPHGSSVSSDMLF
jgi:hypothetical protein